MLGPKIEWTEQLRSIRFNRPGKISLLVFDNRHYILPSHVPKHRYYLRFETGDTESFPIFWEKSTQIYSSILVTGFNF